MQRHVLTCGDLDTNAVLFLEPVRGAALLVDAPEGVLARALPLVEAAGCRLTDLVLTHGHFDHILDAAAARRLGVRVHGHAGDRVLFETPEIMRMLVPDLEIERVDIDHWLEDGERLELLGEQWVVRHVPGHSPGNILLHLPAQGLACVGDVIFAGGVGRTDVPGGDFRTLERSIRGVVYSLPPTTILIPGHGPETTVAEEMEHNPWVPA